MFDTELTRNQDDEFNARVKRSGGKIFLIPEIKFTYYSRDSYSKLWRMFFQYGLFKPLVNRKIKIPSTLRQFAPLTLVLSLLFLSGMSFVHPLFLLFLLIEIVLYEGMILISSISLPKEKGILKMIFHFILSIHVIHFAYGLGYVKGLWKFMLLNEKSNPVNVKMSR